MNPKGDPVEPSAPAPDAPFLGAGWAVGLGAALLIALAVFTAMRWRAQSSGSGEEIVQLPVVTPSPTPTPAVLAPDPGDNP